jgi:hypothetical protein
MTTKENPQNDPVYTKDAALVASEEKEFIKGAPDFPKDNRDGLHGLSLSGGGIRSASFYLISVYYSVFKKGLRLFFLCKCLFQLFSQRSHGSA